MKNIHNIIKSGSIEELKKEIKYGINVDEINYKLNIHNNETALFSANLEQTKILLDAGANINHLNDNKENALFHIIHLNDEEEQYKKMVLLLEAGINVHHKNDNGESFIFFNDLSVKMLKKLEEYKLDFNIKNEQGRNLLFLFLHESQYPTVKYLIDKGVEIFSDPVNNETMLFTITNQKLAELYIENGVDVNQLDDMGRNALMVNNSEKVMDFLIDKNINIHQVDNEGKNALDYCKYYPSIVEKLLNKGIEILRPMEDYEIYRESFKLIKRRFEIQEEKKIINNSLSMKEDEILLKGKKRL